MKEISKSDNKTIVNELLTYFDRICRANDVEYSLSGGSLLGAVRHHGFIPWDDDGDVMLTRSNYEKVKKIFKNVDSFQYGFIDEHTSGYYYGFSKLYDKRTITNPFSPLDQNINGLGVYIDIFPIDKIPDNKQLQQSFSNEILDLNNHMYMSIPGLYYYSSSGSWIREAIKRVLFYPKFIKANRLNKSTDEWHELVLKKLQQYDNTNAKNGGYILSEYTTREIIPYATFMYYQDIEFQGKKFRAISDYKTYLKALYGDYMQLPPENKRHPKHAYISYWKE